MRMLAYCCCFWLLPVIAFSQSSTLKQIEKGEFDKVEKKLNKELAESPNDVELNFSLTVLYVQRAYLSYDPYKAYLSLNNTQELYKAINDDKEYKRLEKIPINLVAFEDYNDSICRCALEDAIKLNRVDAFEKYLKAYGEIPFTYKIIAIEKRDSSAYSQACLLNTVESYKYFISTYPEAIQKRSAENKRNALAFEAAQIIDNIDAYKTFIVDYPDVFEVDAAKKRLQQLEFDLATKTNTSAAYKYFLDTYPQSQYQSEAFIRFEALQYAENTTIGDWQSYAVFYGKFPKNSFRTAALDSVFLLGNAIDSWQAMKFCTDNFSGSNRNVALLRFHDLYTWDGETPTLNRFYQDYDEPILADMKLHDYGDAKLGDALLLTEAYQTPQFAKYDEYIRQGAPRERAFVALQRLIAADIAKEDWSAALVKATGYKEFFGDKNRHFTQLLQLLETPYDKSVTISSVGDQVNTANGNEYLPLLSVNDSLLYFCGKDRADNLGGEDIFVSSQVNNNWSAAKIIKGLSTMNGNDVPLSVSADGSTMVLYKAGKLQYAVRTGNEWSESRSFPEVLNSAAWQSDAVLSSNGKAILFASTKVGGHNLYSDITNYHGDYLYPSDIYVSEMDDNGNWCVPINLGSVINTPYCDRTPFLHHDMKTLYFTSDGHGGLGKMDLFKANRLSDSCWTCWSEPVNMGKEINTEESDAGVKVSNNGDKAYFSKKNPPATTFDIYFVILPSFLRPEPFIINKGEVAKKNE